MPQAERLLVLLVSFALVVVSFTHKRAPIVNDRPIIGILTQPVGNDSYLLKYGTSYIAASYVNYNATMDELDEVFSSINGILFPGGDASLINTPIFKTGQYLYNKALAANDKGDFFPVFGHCMGFELLAIITSQNFSILGQVDAQNISMPLNFTKIAPSSNWFQYASSQVMNILSTQAVTLNNHIQCVTPEAFSTNAYLPKFYQVLSTNKDRHGKVFVSTWEGIKYPVFGIQWHAEKPQFEWNHEEDINHSRDAVLAMQYFSNFMVEQARKSTHHYVNLTQEYYSLIYNYNPIYSEAYEPSFEQVYVF